MTDTLGWIASIPVTIYVGAVTAAYVVTALGSLTQQVNRGPADTAWTAVVCLMFAAIWISHLLRPQVGTTITWMCCVGLAAGVLTTSSGQWVALLWTLVLLITAGTTGNSFLRALSIRQFDSRTELAVLSLTIGIGILSLVTFALAAVGVLMREVLAIALTGLLALQCRTLRGVVTAVRRHGVRPSDRVGVVDASLTTSVAFLLLLGFVWALAPEIQYDAVNYQLTVPKAYLEVGRIVDLPYFWHSYFAHLMNMDFALAMAFGGSASAKLLTWAIAVLAVTAVYCAGRRIGSRRAGLLAAALFASTPTCFWLATTAYVDLAVALFLTGAVLATLNWWRSGVAGWLYAAAAFAGCAVGTKFNSALALPMLATIVVWRLASTQALRVSSVAASVALFSLFAAPWYLLVYLQTGNPTFPFFNGVFASPYWLVEAPIATNFDAFGIGRSPAAVLRLPVAWIQESARFSEGVGPAALGAGLTLLPATFALVLLRRPCPRVLVLISAAHFVLWAVTVQYARYAVPILALGAAAVGGLPRVVATPHLSRLLAGCIIAISLFQSLLTPAMFWTPTERIPLRVVLGRESRERFLTRTLPGYQAVEYLNRHADRDARVYGVGADHLRYYLERPMATVVETPSLNRIAAQFDADRLVAELKKRGYEYALLRPADDVPGRSPFQPWFLKHFARLEFSDGEYAVYRFGRDRSEETTDLLKSPGFEGVRSRAAED